LFNSAVHTIDFEEMMEREVERTPTAEKVATILTCYRRDKRAHTAPMGAVAEHGAAYHVVADGMLFEIRLGDRGCPGRGRLWHVTHGWQTKFAVDLEEAVRLALAAADGGDPDLTSRRLHAEPGRLAATSQTPMSDTPRTMPWASEA